jgi:hypothetical protein
VKPYYESDGIALYHGDCREVGAWQSATVLLTDPPYGIGYASNRPASLPRSIHGDADTELRDWVITTWGDKPALVFGSWRRPRPTGTRMLLIWDTKGALGMGDLSLPWKPAHQEVYVLGSGFQGRRDTDVLSYPPVQSMAVNGRTHPHEKPVDLLQALLAKCPDGAVADPCAGTCATLVAAKNLGRQAVGVEIEERYCETGARRLEQGVLDLGGAA